MIVRIRWNCFHFNLISIDALNFFTFVLGSEASTNDLPIFFTLAMNLQALPRFGHSGNPLGKVLMTVHPGLEVVPSQEQLTFLPVRSWQPAAAGLDIFYLPQCSFPHGHGRLSSII